MIPPSPTARRVLRSLALHQLGQHIAYPDVHGATAQSLRGLGLVVDDPRSRPGAERLRLTAAGWTAVGEMVA